MKTKITIILALTYIFSALNAADEVDYVITNDDTLIGKLSFGLTNAKITQTNGQMTKVDKDQITSYYLDSKRFDKLPLYVNGKNTGKETFMEFVSQRNGLILYKFKCPMSPKVNSEAACVLAVYKDKNFYVQVDQKNAKTIADYFHIKEIVCN